MDLPGFTGFYWVLLGFAGFRWVFLCAREVETSKGSVAISVNSSQGSDGVLRLEGKTREKKKTTKKPGKCRTERSSPIETNEGRFRFETATKNVKKKRKCRGLLFFSGSNPYDDGPHFYFFCCSAMNCGEASGNSVFDSTESDRINVNK